MTGVTVTLDESERRSKETILLHLRARIEAGRQLLASVPGNEHELNQAQVQRANWTLLNRKWLRQTLGDAAGLARLGGTLRDDDTSEERTLAKDVRKHQEMLITEVAQLEKLARVLGELNTST
jgi:hypothetical protein